MSALCCGSDARGGRVATGDVLKGDGIEILDIEDCRLRC
jgi:hypothetical protein